MISKYFTKLFLCISFLLLMSCNDSFTKKMTIQRAIVSSDAKPYYLDFWPVVAAGWKRLGIRPTLILIGDSSVQVDETIGDVIRFEPLPDVDVAMQAQVIRLFAPAFYPDEVSITSDIDMLPVSKTYFHDSVKDKPVDDFVVLRKNAYPDQDRFPMCYNAALGRTFAEGNGRLKILAGEPTSWS